MPGSLSNPRSTPDVCIRTRPSRAWPKFSHQPQDHQLHHRPCEKTSGPIIEIGPGSGALTHPMAHLGRAITAVEVDAKLAAKITQETSSAAVEVVHDDFLNFRLPATPCVIVGNIPFHLTTAILRKLLHAPAWTDAVLLMQWEVARRRAGVGASTMMTAQWSPWFTFHLGSRVPRTAFRPQPNVDGGS